MGINDLEVLFKNNKMIKAKYEFTLIQNRILQKTFFDIQRDKKKFGVLTLENIKELTGNTGTYNIKSIEEILADMMKNDVTQIKSSGNWIKAKVVSAYRYIEKDNAFEVELSQMFQEMVLEYKNGGFTPVSVTKYSNLKGTSSQRLYELLRLWTGSKKIIEYKVEDIREYLHLIDKYKIFGNFKRKVIEFAINDINNHRLMNVFKVEYIKKGKRIDSIKFYVKDLEPRNYTFENKFKKEKIDNDENILLDGQIEVEDFKVGVSSDSELLAAKSKLSVRTIDKLIKDNNIKLVTEAVKILVVAKNVKAPLKYLKGIIENLLKDKKVKGKSKKRESNFTSRDIKADESLFGWDE